MINPTLPTQTSTPMEDRMYAVSTSRIENYVHIEQLVDTLMCIICKCVPLHPLQCKGCEIICCSECYADWSKPNQCPQQCEDPSYKAPSKIVMKFFCDFKISCRFKVNGCQTIIPYESVENHEKECFFQKKRCSEFPQCQQEVLLKDYQYHLKNCEHIKTECVHCKASLPRKETDTHIKNICPLALIKCQFCKKEAFRKLLAKHEEECEERGIKCEKCSKEMKLKEKQDHSCIEYLYSLILVLAQSNETRKKEIKLLKKRIESTETILGLMNQHSDKGDAKEKSYGKNKKAKRDVNAPKKNLTPYFWYMKERRPKLKEEQPNLATKDVAVVIGQEWNTLKEEDKKKFIQQAEEDKKRYNEEKAAYDLHMKQLHPESPNLGKAKSSEPFVWKAEASQESYSTPLKALKIAYSSSSDCEEEEMSTNK